MLQAWRAWRRQRGYPFVDLPLGKQYEIINAQYDGYWFPQVVTISHNDILAKTVTVLSAQFERPELPETLSPADLNIGPGSNLYVKTNNVLQPPQSWDGTKLVPMSTAWHLRHTENYPAETWGRPYQLMPMQYDFGDDDE